MMDFDKDRLVVDFMRGARPGETAEQTPARGGKEFGELRQSPFWDIWAGAAVYEMISAFHRRVVMGEV